MRLAHSQTGSGADRVWGLRRDLSQEVCWTRPQGHIFNVSQLWMTYRHSEEGVCVCVRACAHTRTYSRSPSLFFLALATKDLMLASFGCTGPGLCSCRRVLVATVTSQQLCEEEKKIVGKLVVYSKWKFYGGALWVVYRQRMLSSLLMFFFFFYSFLKKQDADLDVEKVSCKSMCLVN